MHVCTCVRSRIINQPAPQVLSPKVSTKQRIKHTHYLIMGSFLWPMKPEGGMYRVAVTSYHSVVFAACQQIAHHWLATGNTTVRNTVCLAGIIVVYIQSIKLFSSKIRTIHEHPYYPLANQRAF